MMAKSRVPILFTAFFITGLFLVINLFGQNKASTVHAKNTVLADTALNAVSDSVLNENVKHSKRDLTKGSDAIGLQADSTGTNKDNGKEIKVKFVPDPKRALWLSLVLPGAGQIYNKKYWKLPIIYGGFIGCTYALLWNQQMYKDYSRAYIDIMDDDPNTASYNKMLPLGYDITGKEEQFKNIFRHKKDYYRKYRDLSIFAFVGVYLISVVDAYIDAQLSTFDISRDLSMRLEPAVLQHKEIQGNTRALGLQCSFTFK